MTGIERVSEIEEWRPIADFDDYEVSNMGRVRRATQGYRKPAGHILAQSSTYGYPTIKLTKDGKQIGCRVNRLVCRAFHGDPPSFDHHAAHKDNVRDNNMADNLRWAEPSSNMQDKLGHGTVPFGDRNGARLHPGKLARGSRNGKHTKPECTPRGEKHGCAKLTESDVRSIRADLRSERQIARDYGVSRCAINGVKIGKTWSHVS